MESWVAFVPLAVALIAPVVTYVVAARRMSGRIQSSEASDLWTESRSIRDYLQVRLNQEAALRAKLEERVMELEMLNRDLEEKLKEAERRLARGEW